MIWTALTSNFEEKKRTTFSVEEALAHLRSLPPSGKTRAAEYISRAPVCVQTPLRSAVQTEPWFATFKPTS